jgi:periplasmic protein TonB
MELASTNYQRNLMLLTPVPTMTLIMSYQALLFCPDEKTARTVTQVLGELDFNVSPCTEPFAAVKKLMGERFDAVVVDCDNEQNATLLFKSARSAPNNQGALAVAVVEGQAGVAKAFRIGANLVLTKPINVEQAKGTLRVARGLLRKNEGAKPASPVAAPPAPVKPSPPAPPKPTPKPALASVPEKRLAAPISSMPTPVPPAPRPASQSAAASHPLEIAGVRALDEVSDTAPEKSAVQITSQPRASSSQPSAPKIVSATGPAIERPSSTSFAASAPATAREPKAVGSAEGKASPAGPEIHPVETHQKTTLPVAAADHAPAPTLSFAGAASARESSGKGKSILLALVAIVLLAAGGYAAWMKWTASNPANAPVHISQSPATPAPVPQVAQGTAPAAASVSEPPASDTPTPAAHASETPAPAKIAKPSPHAAKDNTAPASTTTSVPTAAENTAVEKAPAPQPIVIKTERPRAVAKAPESIDAPAPSINAIAPASEALPNFSGRTEAPTPVLQKLVISQGVSRGLLIKTVQPVYPQTAIEMRIEGAVQILATVSKNGDISEAKVLGGDQQLAQAALTAVKKWKYKPYLLNGEPVDIQTEITVNFKLPN